MGPRYFWTGVENLAPTGIPSPDRPAQSKSLYRQRYPGPRKSHRTHVNSVCDQNAFCLSVRAGCMCELQRVTRKGRFA